MPSKQAIANTRKSVATLQHLLVELPLAVWYDERDHKFKVSRKNGESIALCEGRYEKVHAYCEGYQRGYLRGRMDADKENQQ
jgi:hypothetical protein